MLIMACSKKNFILDTSVQLIQMYLLMDVLNPIETSTCTTYTWTFSHDRQQVRVLENIKDISVPNVPA